MTRLRSFRSLLWRALERWADHEAPARSAAIAFYSLTSLAPLSVLLVWLGAAAWGRASVRDRITDALTTSVGPEAAALVESVVTEATIPGGEALLSTGIAIVIFLFSATAVLSQLQAALRRVWGVAPREEGRVVGFLRRKLVALLFVGIVGLVLLASMTASVVVAALTHRLGGRLPIPVFAHADMVVAVATLVTVFTIVLRVLPAAPVPWREAALGGTVTAVLHFAGQWVVGIYLARAAIGSMYGAAASLVVLMTWVYYSSLVFLYGAEVTRAVGLGDVTPG